MGFETPRLANEIGSRGEEGNIPQQVLYKPQTQSQSEDSNITQINVHQTTGTAVNGVPRAEESNEHHRPQRTETMGANIQEQSGLVSQNHRDKSTGGTFENNAGNTANINLNDDKYNTAGNNTNGRSFRSSSGEGLRYS